VTDRMAQEIASLEAMDRPALKARWEEAFGRPPSRRVSRDFLLRALAHHVQEKAEGGLSKATLRRIARAGEDLREGRNVAAAPRLRLQPGTRLMREWRGETHIVEVLQDGFAWRGAYYESLSAIARAITGVRWSGPRFFGLRDKRPAIGGDPILGALGNDS